MTIRRLAPWSEAIMLRLEDGAWHHLDELVLVAMPKIPPGHAERTGERARAQERRSRGSGDGPRTKGSAYHTGARRLTSDALNAQRNLGNVERGDAGQWRKVLCRAPRGARHEHEQRYSHPTTGKIAAALRYVWWPEGPASVHLVGMGDMVRSDHCRYDPRKATPIKSASTTSSSRGTN